MITIEVSDRKSANEFLEVPKKLYRKDEAWICPLDRDINRIFDPGYNPMFKEGKAIRWVLKSEDGELIGRIAAFYNLKKAKVSGQMIGGAGFFEVIDDKEAAFILFDTAANWLKSEGVLGFDAPINFGENENHWGLLVDGFTQQGFGMPYNKEYYKAFFEEYGFQNYFEQYSYHKDVASVTEFPERFMKIASWVERKPGYTFEHADFGNIDKFVLDLVAIYNAAWSAFKKDFTPLNPVKVKESFEEAKLILDEDLIWFAYHEGKPIAFYIIIPDLNQILKHFNGKLNLWGKIRFYYYKQRKEMTRMRGSVAGVDPAYQNIGIESVIFKHLFKVYRRKTYYKELELSWVGDFNPKMISIYKALGAIHAKTHITYRYLFDRTMPFVRYKDEIEAEMKS